MSVELIVSAIFTIALRLPVIIVCIIGIVLCTIRVNQFQSSARLGMIAFTILLVGNVMFAPVRMIAVLYVFDKLGSATAVGVFGAVFSVVEALVYAAAFSMLIIAIVKRTGGGTTSSRFYGHAQPYRAADAPSSPCVEPR